MEIEEVARSTTIEDKPRVGDGCGMLRRGLQIGHGEPPTSAEPNMEIHLHVEDRGKPACAARMSARVRPL
jgi:hypothetical protein